MTKVSLTSFDPAGEKEAKPAVHVPAVIDARTIRRRAGTSQPIFAASIGMPASTLRQGEHGRRRPEKAADVLPALLQRNPWLVEEWVALPREPSPFILLSPAD